MYVCVYKQLDMQWTLAECDVLCRGLGRTCLSFQTVTQRVVDKPAIVKVQITHSSSGARNLMSCHEFLDAFQALENEARHAIENEARSSKTTVPKARLFGSCFLFGTATVFMGETSFLLPTEDDQRVKPIRCCTAPFNKVGNIEISLTPTSSRDENAGGDSAVLDPAELLGKPWSYKLQIGSITGLDTTPCHTYCQYEFDGKFYVTQAERQKQTDLKFSHSCMLSVKNVDGAFLDYLRKGRLTIAVFICAAGDFPGGKLCSICGNAYLKDGFSVAQWKRNAQGRVCGRCTGSTEEHHTNSKQVAPLVLCSRCGNGYLKESFSNRQQKKSPQTRVCEECSKLMNKRNSQSPPGFDVAAVCGNEQHAELPTLDVK
jgi:hypothetical protein